MRSNMVLSLLLVGLGGPELAAAQVEVNAGGTKVEVAPGAVGVHTGDTKVEARARTRSARVHAMARVSAGVDGKAQRLRRARVVRCRADEEVVLRGVVIDSADLSVRAADNCVLRIEDSVVRSRGRALTVAGNAEVTLVNSTVEASQAAVLTGNATLTVLRSVVKGKTKVADNGEIDRDEASVFTL